MNVANEVRNVSLESLKYWMLPNLKFLNHLKLSPRSLSRDSHAVVGGVIWEFEVSHAGLGKDLGSEGGRSLFINFTSSVAARVILVCHEICLRDCELS